MTIHLNLPWPPSANHMYTVVRGRKILSDKGRRYRELTSLLALQQRDARVVNGRLRVEIEARPPDSRRRDLDNLLKMPIDCAKNGGCFADDSQIDELRIVRGPVSKTPILCVRISEIA